MPKTTTRQAAKAKVEEKVDCSLKEKPGKRLYYHNGERC